MEKKQQTGKNLIKKGEKRVKETENLINKGQSILAENIEKVEKYEARVDEGKLIPRFCIK